MFFVASRALIQGKNSHPPNFRVPTVLFATTTSTDHLISAVGVSASINYLFMILYF